MNVRKLKNADKSVQKYPFLKFLKKLKAYIVGVYRTFLVIILPKGQQKTHGKPHGKKLR